MIRSIITLSRRPILPIGGLGSRAPVSQSMASINQSARVKDRPISNFPRSSLSSKRSRILWNALGFFFFLSFFFHFHFLFSFWELKDPQHPPPSPGADAFKMMQWFNGIDPIWNRFQDSCRFLQILADSCGFLRILLRWVIDSSKLMKEETSHGKRIHWDFPRLETLWLEWINPAPVIDWWRMHGCNH